MEFNTGLKPKRSRIFSFDDHWRLAEMLNERMYENESIKVLDVQFSTTSAVMPTFNGSSRLEVTYSALVIYQEVDETQKRPDF